MANVRSPLSGTLCKDGRWCIRVTLTRPDGAKYKQPVYGGSQREVQATVRALLAENPRRAAPVKRTVSELIDYCEAGPWARHADGTKRQYAWARARIDEHLGSEIVGKLTVPIIYAWVVRLTSDPSLSGRSVQIHRNVLRVALEQAVFLGWIKVNPAKGWRAPVDASPKATERMTPEEIAAIIASEDTLRYRVFLQTLWETGARPEESTRLTAEMLEQRGAQWWVHIPGTKTQNAPRIVPISNELANSLLDLGEPWFSYTRRAWTHIWHRAQAREGTRPKRTRLKRKAPDKNLPTIYALRKARITEWKEIGVSDEVWIALAGHEDAELTRRIYDKPTMKRIARQLGLVDI